MREKFKSFYNKETVLDTCTIIDLQRLEILDLPLRVFSKVYITKNIIIEELEEDLSKQLIEIGYEPISLETEDGYGFLFQLDVDYKKLSTSDKIVIATAYERNIICCTNDSPARNACIENDITLTGTLGIICCAFENGIITRKELINLINRYDTGIEAHISYEVISQIRNLYKIPQSINTSDTPKTIL
jgi:predicted nucleic acid-binding protein